MALAGSLPLLHTITLCEPERLCCCNGRAEAVMCTICWEVAHLLGALADEARSSYVQTQTLFLPTRSALPRIC